MVNIDIILGWDYKADIGFITAFDVCRNTTTPTHIILSMCAATFGQEIAPTFSPLK